MLSVKVSLGSIMVALLHQLPNLLRLFEQYLLLLPDLVLLCRDLLLHLHLVPLPVAEPS
jgi:hypothetical protein